MSAEGGATKPTVDPALQRQAKIKTSTLVRNLKDLKFAKDEVAKEQDRLKKFETENPDRVNQQKKVIEEAEMMVPHAEQRIQRSTTELRNFLGENEEALDEESVQAAQKALDDSDALFQQDE